MEFKGDVIVKRTLVADRRVDQALLAGSAGSLVRHSAYWQSISGGGTVIMPDATTLLNGWEVVVEAVGTDVDVQDGSTGALVTVANGTAVKFTLTGNGATAGTWYYFIMASAGSAPALRYVLTHDASTDWGSPSAGYYTITTTGVTHGMGNNPNIQYYEDVGGGALVEVTPDQSGVNSSNGDADFRVPDDPDLRYAGQVVFV